jgi:hypothetical protein
MNVLFWILQVLLALHTISGALWKFSNSRPSLSAIPHGVWLAMSVVELLCALALILPAFKKSLGKLPAIAATFIAAEMLLFTGLNLSSGQAKSGEIAYWLVVAGICAFLAYGRFVLRPLAPRTASTAT